MVEELEIVLATSSDLEEVARLEAESFPAPWKQEFFEGELVASGRFNRVVKDLRHRVAGYLFAMHYHDELHINKICVSAHLRRQRIATRLMDECIRFCREQQIHTISLEVRASNRGAQDFYRGLDFAPLYTRPSYYPDGEAAVVMLANIG